jgi:membrane-associated phospholipid phosphatase
MDDKGAELLVQWAGWAGQHALPLFFVSLALMLGASGTFWWALLRYAGPATDTRLPPLLVLVLRVAAGFAVIVAGAVVFAELADGLEAEEALGRADQAFTDALARHVPAAAVQVFAALTVLGDPATLTTLCLVVAAALWAAGRRWLAPAWVLTLVGGAALNFALKQVFARIRPVHDGLVLADGYSFPSGHSSGSVITYGMLAYLAMRLAPQRWHVPVALAVSALAVTIGASRMFLRVHYASDVIAGFALGAAWLAVCIVSIELTRWLRKRRMRGDT